MNPKNTSLFQGPYHLNKMRMCGKQFYRLIFILLLFISCDDKKTEDPPDFQAKIVFQFHHTIDQVPVFFDSLMYENPAGNPFLVNEIQYFISDVKLYHQEGNVKRIDDWKAIHYVDSDIVSTMTWEVYDPIDPGVYDSVSFTFGISEERNLSFMYVNPPEKDMFWPEILGGGYHYLKLNGKWLPEGQTVQTAPFDFHLGIGQIYYSYPDSITGFAHNYFNVSLSASGFTLDQGETKDLSIIMQVEKWFMEPHIYNHDVYGGYIMQNQDVMQKVKENGYNVFAFEVSTTKED